MPDDPIIPFIEGDGTGPDIWRASVRVLDAAVEKAYGGKRKIAWMEVSPARRASSSSTTGCRTRRSRRSASTRRHQGTADDAGGRRHPLAERRPAADARPVRLPAAGALVQGRAVAGKHPEKVDMVIFRENTEDIYAGIEYAAGTPEAQKVLDFFAKEFPKEFKKIRFGTEAAAREWQQQLEAIGAPQRERRRRGRRRPQADQLSRHRAAGAQRDRLRGQDKRKSVTLVHKGNIMKFTEGAFRDWGYKVAKEFYGAVEIDGGPWCRIPDGQAGRRPRHQGRDRRHHAAAGADAAGRVRRHRDAEPERRLPVRRAARRRSAASASRRAATSTTSPATPSSRRRTARRRSTPTRTR